MRYRFFRHKLFFTMIIFAIIISFTISTINYFQIKDILINNNLAQLQEIEDTIEYSLQTAEKALHIFDEDTTVLMEKTSLFLQDYYDQHPNLDVWDFEQLKNNLQMDIYMINDENIITHSSFKEDVGLNFNKCCSKLVPILDKRRNAGLFYHDGMDIEQNTGKIKKYSYMATKDKKYLIQLGISLENSPVFQEFNFLQIQDQLVKKYPFIQDINVLNIGGLTLGSTSVEGKLSGERRQAFDHVLATKETIEIEDTIGDENVIYRYSPYVSQYDVGATQDKVIEITYNNAHLINLLDEAQQTFCFQLLVILLVTILLALLISSWVSKPIHMAFHDSLTGLKNRAAFDELVCNSSNFSKEPYALCMIDIDNFKRVNDSLGHDKGDQLLKDVAKILKSNVSNNDQIIRYGGDEFIIILQNISQNKPEEVMKRIISAISDLFSREERIASLNVSASIGIAFSPEHDHELEGLYKKADMALYMSKEKGKNQYQIYCPQALKTFVN